jgi:hypothetical protein
MCHEYSFAKERDTRGLQRRREIIKSCLDIFFWNNNDEKGLGVLTPNSQRLFATEFDERCYRSLD